MSWGRQNTGMTDHFILTEIREMRKDQAGRDSDMRSEFASVRDAMATLAETVTRSQANVENVQTNVDHLNKTVTSLKTEVHEIKQNQTVNQIRDTSKWDGPKQIATVLLAVGGVASALVAIIKFAPYIQFIPNP